jgi:hypothetical protein
MANLALVAAELSCEVARDRLVEATHERDAARRSGLHWVVGVVHVRVIVAARLRMGASVGLHIVRLRLTFAVLERADRCPSCSM